MRGYTMHNLHTSNGVFFDNHYQISVRLASCKQLKKAHLIILADTLSFNSQGRVNFKSQDRIASECGVHRHTVITAIKQLREWGLLSANESKFKETLKLVVNYPNMIRFIEANEAVYQKANFNPTDEDTVAELKENGWMQENSHDVEKLDIDEDHKNHDVENFDTRCREIRQPMSKTSTLIDHLIDHELNTLSKEAPKNSFPRLEDIHRDLKDQLNKSKRAQGGFTFSDLNPDLIPQWAEHVAWSGLKSDHVLVWGKFVAHYAASRPDEVFSVNQVDNLWHKWIKSEKIYESKQPTTQRGNHTGNNERKPAGERIREKFRNKGFDI
ncbi:hypothetical protein MARILYN_21 [Vibrio phage Marilyn]|nr:hypothetical protein MARILYN_21 [Vibrio phage Marilyn]WCD55544.1 hypothetical protein FAYDEN_21 [Vibrio phage Fayden]WCD55601.1 hypothetical protein BAYBAE_21 [Vibrio phage Baybae]WCD55660.1 hypothetical protein VAITEPHAGE_21 [Vibrio phage Vaitephage]